jgi:hypothetical protein
MANNIMSQLRGQTGLGRPGGMASSGSTPLSPNTGGRFAAMENAMLKQLKPKPKALAQGKSTRQFKKGAGENTGQV